MTAPASECSIGGESMKKKNICLTAVGVGLLSGVLLVFLDCCKQAVIEKMRFDDHRGLVQWGDTERIIRKTQEFLKSRNAP